MTQLDVKSALDYLTEARDYLRTRRHRNSSDSDLELCRFTISCADKCIQKIEYDTDICPTVMIIAEFIRQHFSGQRVDLLNLYISDAYIHKKITGLNYSNRNKVKQVLSIFINSLYK